MCWRRIEIAAALLTAAACGEPRDDEAPNTQFSYEEPAEPVPAAVLHADSVRSAEGQRVVTIDLFLPTGIKEAVARATLQQVIDSVAEADTLAAAVLAIGFVMGTPDPEAGEADLVPAIRAFWGPIDTIGMTRSQRRAHFRTQFTILRSFATGASQDTP